MKIHRDEPRWMETCPIPAIFIEEKMNGLTREALKLYLALMLESQRGEAVEEETLIFSLGLREDEYRSAVTLLIRQGLLRAEGEAYVLTDLRREKAMEVPEEKAPSPVATPEERERETVVQQINDTLFNGGMPVYFYREIDSWFENYQFDPPVVYAILMIAAGRDKLDGTAYAAAIARDLSKHGVRSYDDLNAYNERCESLRGLSGKISSALGQKNLWNDFCMAALDTWVNDWGFSDEVILEAVKRASLNGSPNYNYIGAILENWHEAGVESLEDVLRYEASHQRKSSRSRKSGMGNFEQRKADESETLYFVPGTEGEDA